MRNTLLLVGVVLGMASCSEIENEPTPTVYAPASFDYELNNEYEVTETALDSTVLQYPIVFDTDTTGFLDLTFLVEPQIVNLNIDWSSTGCVMCVDSSEDVCHTFVYTNGVLIATTSDGNILAIE